MIRSMEIEVDIRFCESVMRDGIKRVATSREGGHPVAEFRRMAAQVVAETDRALVAIHGEPDAESHR